MDNEWSEWSKHILLELQRLDRANDKLVSEINDLDSKLQKRFESLHIDIVTLKVKSSMWGAVAGVIATVLIESVISMILHLKS